MAKLGKVTQQRQPSTSALPPSSLSDAQNSCQCRSPCVPWHCWCFTITTQTRTISHIPALAAQLGLPSPRCPASLLQSPLPSILTPLWDTTSFRPPPNPLTCTGQFWEQNDPWCHCQLGSPAQGMSAGTRDVRLHKGCARDSPCPPSSSGHIQGHSPLSLSSTLCTLGQGHQLPMCRQSGVKTVSLFISPGAQDALLS